MLCIGHTLSTCELSSQLALARRYLVARPYMRVSARDGGKLSDRPSGIPESLALGIKDDKGPRNSLFRHEYLSVSCAPPIGIFTEPPEPLEKQRNQKLERTYFLRRRGETRAGKSLAPVALSEVTAWAPRFFAPARARHACPLQIVECPAEGGERAVHQGSKRPACGAGPASIWSRIRRAERGSCRGQRLSLRLPF